MSVNQKNERYEEYGDCEAAELQSANGYELKKLLPILEAAEAELRLSDIPDRESARQMLARYLVDHGVRGWGVAKWQSDTSYAGKNKAIYRCSACGHYQSAKLRAEKMMYMRYCPFCGRRSFVREERK